VPLYTHPAKTYEDAIEECAQRAEALELSGNRRGRATSNWQKENPDKQKINASNGGKLRGKITGSKYWWNDGTNNTRSVDCPGENWVRGMLMSEKKLKQVMTIAGHNKGNKKNESIG